MRLFLTGANGFIGGAVASAMLKAGHTVRGLVRDRQKAALVAAHGIEPVIGSLDDVALLHAEALAADSVINAANSDHRPAIEAMLAAMQGSGKPFLHTSGSSIVGDEAMGDASDRIYYEDSVLTPEPDKVARIAIDRLVREAPGVRGVVLCNTMIYGNAMGAPAASVQIPALLRQAQTSGVARYIGAGLNRWSNVHIADVAALYVLALDKATAGTFMYVESGEETLGNVVRAIAERCALGTAQSWPASDAIAAWGREMAVFALGSNSRVRGDYARTVLGWSPQHHDIAGWITQSLHVQE